MTRTCTHGLPFLKGVYGRSVVVQGLSVVKQVWVQTKVDVIHQVIQTGGLQSQGPRGQELNLIEEVLDFHQFFGVGHLQ